jgi:hypothetical protein
MSQRITRAMLDRKLEALNAATGQPLTYFAGDSREASIGHYYLEGSTCGGWQLNQVMNTSGGVYTISSGGYVSMRALYEQIACAIEVIRTVKG